MRAKVIASRNSLPSQELQRADLDGLKGCPGQGGKHELQTPGRHNDFGVFTTLDSSPQCGVEANGVAIDKYMPARDSCHIALDGVHQQSSRLELEEVQNKLQRCANGILIPFTTPASEPLPPALVYCLSGVLSGSKDRSDSIT